MEREPRRPEITRHMGAYIKSRRTELKLSLDELAETMKCSKAHIWELEKGRAKNPSLWMVLALCEGLQCSLNSLLGEDVSKPILTDAEMALIAAHRKIFN